MCKMCCFPYHSSEKTGPKKDTESPSCMRPFKIQWPYPQANKVQPGSRTEQQRLTVSPFGGDWKGSGDRDSDYFLMWALPAYKET